MDPGPGPHLVSGNDPPPQKKKTWDLRTSCGAATPPLTAEDSPLVAPAIAGCGG